ncbi:MAG: 3-phosphoshikimate 1-carboxyvinyltransferase [Ruminococcus sp.]|nr:3-phosphoshikimate 1-carboxyvinyltransferase [Ruminococcus sp.]
MVVTILPKKLKGEVNVPPSKSVAHRLVIAAALAEGRSVVKNLSFSKDITATVNAMRALGAQIDIKGDTAVIRGIEKVPEKAVIDCCESGSTLRFLIPVACALGVETTFLGQGKLPQRPITPYIEELPKHGAEFVYEGTMPFTVKGRLECGEYKLRGDISSQFVTGLMFALALLKGESRITLTSPLESKPYVDITADCLSKCGAQIICDENGYTVKGAALHAFEETTEADYSQAAFFYVANSLGSSVKIKGLNEKSYQGDKKIVEICEEIVYNNNGSLKPFELDCSDIPDLVPILAVLASFCEGKSRIYNVGRLRIKESDRLEAVRCCLNAMGGNVTAGQDFLVIEGAKSLEGAKVDCFNDHRIAMAMAVASTRCKSPVTLVGAQCVEKSYPDFFDVLKTLGAELTVEN